MESTRAIDPGGVRERLWKAVGCLAASADPIQQRLEGAGLELVPLQPRNFRNDETRKEFSEIMRALTSVEGSGEEGAIRVTTAAMSDEDAEQVAGRIVGLDSAYRQLV